MSIASLEAALSSIDEFVSTLEPTALTCDDAARLVEVFIKGERICHAGKTISAGRAAEGKAHSGDGYKDASSWLAEKAGEPVRQARAELDTAARLLWLEGTGRAFRAGELSGAQAQSIAEAASADPAAEKDLLDRARTGSLRELHDECERVKAAARSVEEEEARYERVRRQRYLRIWHGADGATKGQFSLTPDAGARLMASLQPWADRFFEDARQQARREPSEAYMADALLAAVTGENPLEALGQPAPAPRDGEPGEAGQVMPPADDGGLTAGTPVQAETGHGASPGASPGPGRPRERDGDLRRAPPPATVICRVDLSALRRGALAPGEVCEIPGVGPVPVSIARELLTDCFLKLVITDGVEVRSVVHYGRTLTAHQRTALEYRDPYCVVPGCGRSFGLENDHIVEFALGGPTRLENMCRLCRLHHGLKTHHGYRIQGRPGAWEWVPPRDRRDSALSAEQTTVSSPGRPDRSPRSQRAAALMGQLPPGADSGSNRPLQFLNRNGVHGSQALTEGPVS